MITGANQGGKSTFLRSLGLAQLMLQAGMFVPAESFRASVAPRRLHPLQARGGRHDGERQARRGAAPDERRSPTRSAPAACCSATSRSPRPTSAKAPRSRGSVIRRDARAPGSRSLFVTHLYDLAQQLLRAGARDGALPARRAAAGRRAHLPHRSRASRCRRATARTPTGASSDPAACPGDEDARRGSTLGVAADAPAGPNTGGSAAFFVPQRRQPGVRPQPATSRLCGTRSAGRPRV